MPVESSLKVLPEFLGLLNDTKSDDTDYYHDDEENGITECCIFRAKNSHELRHASDASKETRDGYGYNKGIKIFHHEI